MTLRLKLLVLVAAVTLFAATGVTSVALWRGVLQAERQLSQEASAVASSVAALAQKWASPTGLGEGAAAALLPLLRQELHDAELLQVSIVDRRGEVALCADVFGAECTSAPPSPPGRVDEPLEFLRRMLRDQPLEERAPLLTADGEPFGEVRISYRSSRVRREAQRLAGGAGLIALVFVGLGLTFATVLLRRITRPLTEVVRAAERLAEGEKIEVQVAADRELSELVAAFNRMAARLRERREEMEHLIASLNERVARAMEEGMRSERLVTVGGIAAGFAHEMGNSLHVIAGFAAVVLRELPPDHANRTDVEALRREAARASALLERFLFFARARSARRALQPVDSVVREAVEVIGPAAIEARVTTDLSIEPGLPDVDVDAELLRQAFVNLCINAVQAMSGRGGHLSVRALRRGSDVAFEFQDTGPGVAPEARERIFEPFFTTKENGTGLGLAIVRHAAEAHGGRAEVESTSSGALFRIVIPAAAAEAAA
jgi:signal transduction histidine kinase